MSVYSWFDDCPDRKDRPSLKWGKYSGRDILPLWVADMDFRAPPAVVETARKEAEFGNYGYATTPTVYTHAVLEVITL